MNIRLKATWMDVPQKWEGDDLGGKWVPTGSPKMVGGTIVGFTFDGSKAIILMDDNTLTRIDIDELKVYDEDRIDDEISD